MLQAKHCKQANPTQGKLIATSFQAWLCYKYKPKIHWDLELAQHFCKPFSANNNKSLATWKSQPICSFLVNSQISYKYQEFPIDIQI